MSSSLFEIVELSDGRVGLRRAGEDGEPLVAIQFSREAEVYLNDSKLEVVKAMIEAGLEVVGDMAEQASTDFELEAESRTLH